ncbi:FFLEELY motif protein [Wenzhouxiangella sediminis]|uniref:DUF8198 domain-containing protein n=1 Tax=Wenzhouxiangella sediminis TaxID=1792836 RepID=A0A3E1KCL4_9GAMM|nr:hypothetical protein [Wenzhouxiangella sediminis]RFF32710.1 hypothetical protein DZC52_00895 [Wenzhouxiangella sediminis]
MSRSRADRHLEEQVDRNLRIAHRIPDEGPLRDALDRLQRWQRARLDETYADLAAQPRFRPACEFFLDELYGGRDVHARDRQLKRVLPVMRRFLPDHLLHATGEAMRLQAVSLEFDFELAGLLVDVPEIGQPDYARAYRRHGEWAARREQIALIHSLGELLDETVRRTMVRRLVRIMRRPAEVGGVGLLQNFLERGLGSFARMKGAEAFLATIKQRETQALEAMQAGEDWPFEPWIGRGPESVQK